MSQELTDILQRLDPLTIIGDYVVLKQMGRTAKGLCPFHSEKTPSFHVNPELGLWHCFGCGAGGNLFQFLMKINNIPFVEAKERLAQRAGIELTPFSEAQNKKKKLRYEILEAATNYYHELLTRHKLGEPGLLYLESRGISSKTIQTFKLGFASSEGHGLCQYLLKQGYPLDVLRELGLVSKLDPPRDYFYKRIIFPICNATGQTIAFGGRSLGEEQPKYLNSPESTLFKKGETLYALHLAKASISQEDCALLTEGYMDTLIAHQHGFPYTVASLGTSLTSSQAKILHRFVTKVIVCYDGDAAGIEAMRRALSIIEGVGLEIRFSSFPAGDDPDSFLRKKGSEAFFELLKKAASPVDFITQLAESKYGSKTPEDKKRIIEEVGPLIRAIRDPILKDAYLKKLSDTLNISESAIRRGIGTKSENPKTSISSTKLSREKEILRWILWEPIVAESVWKTLTPLDFLEDETREAAEILHLQWRDNIASLSEIENVRDEIIELFSRLSTEAPIGEISTLSGLISSQKNQLLKKELELLKEQLGRKIKEGKVDSTDEAYKKYLSLLRRLKGQEAGV